MGCRPPPNYVAGLGRGATGFTTRSDIGPARAAPLGGVSPPAAPCDDTAADVQKFEEFEGSDAGLLMSTVYDEDDRRADEEWAHVDQEMGLRRKNRREARVKQEIENYRASNPSIREQFLDLKRKLADEMNPEDWESIPEIGDYSRRNKRRRFEQFVPVPDMLFEKARQEKVFGTTVDPREARTDLRAVGEGRSKVLSLSLDRLSKGQTPIDPTGYLTDLNSMQSNAATDISDTKKLRLLLKSVNLANPKHAPGWIATARLEEMTGKLQAARRTIQMGCQSCRNNEDVWLEACRLSAPNDAKGVLVQALKANPKSVKLWLRAAQLEKDNAAKSEVLKKGLEHNQDSSLLWKALVELANVDDARVLLARAVECCGCVDLWLALAKLETYDRAKEVLNMARRSLPGEPTIWIFAATLEEANGSDASVVRNIIEKAIRRLQLEGAVIEREDWLRRAEAAERGNSILTCQAIVKATLGMGVDEEDRKGTWLADAAASRKRGLIETARAIYAHALSVFPTKKSIWMETAKLEKAHGTKESLDSLLQRAVQHCPEVEILWLMAAKEKWLAGDLPGARCILEEAFLKLPNSEEVLLAAFKLEFESREPERARKLLLKARQKGGKERVWMKSAMVERELGNLEEERKLLEEGLMLFPMFHKLWLMLGQLEERLGNSEAAMNVYEKALQKCSDHDTTPLWLSAASLAERTCGLNKERAILTSARLRNKESPELWLAAIRAEIRAGNRKEAEVLTAKALQGFPRSGLLWAAAIELSPPPQRKTKCSDAVVRTNGDAYVTAVVGRLFWQELKIEKARLWMEKAVESASDIGDLWALYYSMELQQSTPEKQQQVVTRCKLADPKYGERWLRVSKAIENAHLPVEEILKKVALSFGRYKYTILH